MKVALAVISDRQDLYINECLASVKEHLPRFDHTIFVDDSGAGGTRSAFDESIFHPQRRGLAAAVNSAWTAATNAGVDYLFHLEEDTVLLEPVPIARMAYVLKRVPKLAQVALLHHFTQAEEAWVGHPSTIDTPDFEERFQAGAFVTFCEPKHPERVFTLHPSLIPRRVFAQGWPAGNEEEMTHRCAEQGLHLGYWGRKSDAPRCAHIGEARSAGWML